MIKPLYILFLFVVVLLSNVTVAQGLPDGSGKPGADPASAGGARTWSGQPGLQLSNEQNDESPQSIPPFDIPFFINGLPPLPIKLIFAE